MSGPRSPKGNRQKGMRYELAIRRHLELRGFAVENRNRSGYDGDDLRITAGDTTLSIEAKNQKTMALAAWVDQAETNSGDTLPIVIHKRTGKSVVGDHYATMSVATLERILAALNR